MKEKINKLIEILKELNKLLEQFEKLIWRLGSIITVICYIIYQLKK